MQSVSIKDGLRTGFEIRTRYKTRTGKYGLGIKHGQGIKRGLRTGYKIRTTDYFGKNGANWFQVRKNKIKRSPNGKTRVQVVNTPINQSWWKCAARFSKS